MPYPRYHFQLTFLFFPIQSLLRATLRYCAWPLKNNNNNRKEVSTVRIAHVFSKKSYKITASASIPCPIRNSIFFRFWWASLFFFKLFKASDSSFRDLRASKANEMCCFCISELLSTIFNRKIALKNDRSSLEFSMGLVSMFGRNVVSAGNMDRFTRWDSTSSASAKDRKPCSSTRGGCRVIGGTKWDNGISLSVSLHHAMSCRYSVRAILALPGWWFENQRNWQDVRNLFFAACLHHDKDMAGVWRQGYEWNSFS